MSALALAQGIVGVLTRAQIQTAGGEATNQNIAAYNDKKRPGTGNQHIKAFGIDSEKRERSMKIANNANPSRSYTDQPDRQGRPTMLATKQRCK
jgi:hypothetical protein